MKLLAKFIIDGKPHIKKNSRVIMRNFRTGKPFLGKSTKLRNAEKFTTLSIRSQKNQQKLKKIDFEIIVKFSFYLPTKRLPDLSNLYQLYEDCLEKAGVIENDKLIAGHDGSRRYLDRERPRIEIEIFKLKKV